MSLSFKTKIINGLLWSFIDNIAVSLASFVVGLILARLLSPTEYGLVGMTTFFISISTCFINGGFSHALIRKIDCTDSDYSTVFYFNFVVGVILFATLFISAPFISNFFHEKQLCAIVKVLSVILIIDSLTIIQRTILFKRVNFKLLTKISVVSSLISGSIAIALAFMGFGVWSLVAHQISQRGFNALLLWLWNRWVPSLKFSVESFRNLFSFGSYLLLSALVDTIYRNIYYLIIGKYFSAMELGYYSKAEGFKNLPSQNLSGVISRVSYPVLSSMQGDFYSLKKYYRKMIRCTMLVTFILMLGMAVVAEPMVIALIGEAWRPSIVYLQILCFVGMFYPLHALNLNMINVLGRSDLFFKLELVTKIFTIPIVVIGIIWGIKILIIGMLINVVIDTCLIGYCSGKLLDYSFKSQVMDIVPSFLLAFIVNFSVYLLGFFLPIDPIGILIAQVLFGAFLTVAICEIVKFEDYFLIKILIHEKYFKLLGD